MKTAREICTQDFWRKSQAVLFTNDPFARESLILLAQSYRADIEPLASAATMTLLAASIRNGSQL